MFVRLLIGRQAGAIVEMPWDAATSGLAMGTAASVTPEEIVAAGFEPPLAPVEATPEGPPDRYAIRPGEMGGFDVFDANGDLVNDEPLPNLAAARSVAHEHAATMEALIVRIVVIPDEWQTLAWPELRALAKQFDPTVTTKEESIAAIEAELLRRAEPIPAV